MIHDTRTFEVHESQLKVVECSLQNGILAELIANLLASNAEMKTTQHDQLMQTE